eukprot:Polyplicarium_translucidae@DN3091_c0_g2_i1.p3
MTKRGTRREEEEEEVRAPAPPPARRGKVPPEKRGKSAADPDGEQTERRKRRARGESYSTYIVKVLKQIHPNTGISKRSMMIMNSFMIDIFERIATEAGKLCKMTKKETLGMREIQSAVRLVLPGELAKHAVTEGQKAVTKYDDSVHA